MLLLKVNFAKAFDSVSWKFLDNTLHQMNFSLKWISWIKWCLESAKISVLVNGRPTAEFAMDWGLRQGDPLSPFLFILVAKTLNVMMEEFVTQGLFHPMDVENDNINLSHLQFAGDATFYGEWSTGNARSLLAILKCFDLVSGLKLNLDKTKLFGVGVQMASVSSLTTALGRSAASLPFTYLGLPYLG